MRAWELIRETYLRRGYIRIVHISWFATYALLFLVPWPPEMGWQWPPLLFGWSGCMLPALISAGIFGNDIASGRIAMLVTKPIQSIELYMYRLLGLSLQCAAHILISGLIIFALQQATNRGAIDNLALWMIAAWFISNAILALSTSLSVVVEREHNAVVLIVTAIAVSIAWSILVSFAHDHIATLVFDRVVRYAFPPVQFLAGVAMGRCDALRSISYLLYALGLTLVYCLIGIILLDKRQFKSQPD